MNRILLLDYINVIIGKERKVYIGNWVKYFCRLHLHEYEEVLKFIVDFCLVF